MISAGESAKKSRRPQRSSQRTTDAAKDTDFVAMPKSSTRETPSMPTRMFCGDKSR
jgi:hypothetical protein